MIADLDPIETAAITAQFPNFLGTALESRRLSVFFAPRDDEALLRFRMSGNDYLLCLPREARALVRKAAIQYNEDFDARRLDRDIFKSKSERIYGEIEGCRMEWRLGSLAMNGEASPKVAAGYLFEDRSPYFAITVYSADNLNYDSSGGNIEKSVTYAIYLNKEQSLALADALSEAALLSAVDTVAVPIFSPDEYNDDVQGNNDGADAYGGADIYGGDDNGR